MRAALAGLTTRGRSFLAAGAALVVCSLALGERDLLRVGIFLLALPAVALVVVTRTRYRLSCKRTLDAARVQAGQTSRVILQLENVSRLPTGVLLVEDALPYVLGGRPRFVLDKVEPQGVREVAYSVRSDLRGRYAIGPLSVRLTDPFGFCELTRSFRAVDHLVVTPVVTPLPALRLGGDRSGGGESRARAVAVAGQDDVATREYRQGDDLRRVHWRSTAHAGELMVRREEQPWHSRATLLLDTRAGAHRGDGPGSSFEWAVSAAASVGVHLVRNRYSLRYVTDTCDELHGVGGVSDIGGGPFEGRFLDALAVSQTSRVSSLDAAVAALRRGGDGVLIAVLGALTADDTAALSRLPHGGSVCVAVLVDTMGWTSLAARARMGAEEAFAASNRLLARAGWRVLSMPPRSSLADAWPLAAADLVTSAARDEATKIATAGGSRGTP